jgi:hypothetical protein
MSSLKFKLFLTFAKFVSGECFIKRLSLLGVSLSHFPLFFLLLALFSLSVSTLHLASASLPTPLLDRLN